MRCHHDHATASQPVPDLSMYASSLMARAMTSSPPKDSPIRYTGRPPSQLSSSALIKPCGVVVVQTGGGVEV